MDAIRSHLGGVTGSINIVDRLALHKVGWREFMQTRAASKSHHDGPRKCETTHAGGEYGAAGYLQKLTIMCHARDMV